MNSAQHQAELPPLLTAERREEILQDLYMTHGIDGDGVTIVIDAVIDALAALKAAPAAVPAGWKLVPISPTEEMLAAGYVGSTEAGGIQDLGVAYAAMLAAAHSPVAEEVEAVAYTTERHIALREAHEIAASNDYFSARPQLDSDGYRKNFEAGFYRGFDKAEELFNRTAHPPAASDERKDAERRFPMQRGPSIPWSLAEAIYAGYSALYGGSQTLERLAERGGFSWPEVEVIYNDRDKRSKAAIDAALAAQAEKGERG